MKKRKFRSFEPTETNQERLEFAANTLGLNISEVLNELLEKHLKKHLEQKTERMREALSVPVP
jgi:hypothetical protein